MNNSSISMFDDSQVAAGYDQRFEKLAPFKDTLHLILRFTLSDLPEDARILCVGAGTGAELEAMALHNPKWVFTAVEPARAMLDLCKKRAESAGFADRCEFYVGCTDTLNSPEPYDAATSILVSQFVLKQEERIRFYQDISDRLKPGGRLLSVDLSPGDGADTGREAQMRFWLKAIEYTGVPAENLEMYEQTLQNNVSVLPEQEIEDIISQGGFEKPVPVYQALLMRGWYAQKATD